MTEFVIISFFAAFFLAIVDNYTAFKIGKLFVSLGGSTLGAALMYSGDPLQSVATAFASAFFAYVLLEVAYLLLVG